MHSAKSTEENCMSQVYNPEAEVIAEIEKLELDAREFRRKIEHVRNAEDRRVMNRLLGELRDRITFLKRKLP
jgi:hypothetical protein